VEISVRMWTGVNWRGEPLEETPAFYLLFVTANKKLEPGRSGSPRYETKYRQSQNSWPAFSRSLQDLSSFLISYSSLLYDPSYPYLSINVQGLREHCPGFNVHTSKCSDGRWPNQVQHYGHGIRFQYINE
jgi:hypothetical protein